MKIAWASVRVHVREDAVDPAKARHNMECAARDEIASGFAARGYRIISETFSMSWENRTEGVARAAGVSSDGSRVLGNGK